MPKPISRFRQDVRRQGAPPLWELQQNVGLPFGFEAAA
jgi:hypothetical protein